MTPYSPSCDYLSFSFDSLHLDAVVTALTAPGLFSEVVISDRPRPINFLSSRPGQARLGYTDCIEFYSGDYVAFRLFTGGINEYRPLIVASGYKADYLRRGLYELYRCHPDYSFKITRVDVAIDFISSQFQRMAYKLDCLAECSGIKSSVVGDFLRGKDGRTLYLGSRSSRFFFRLYEKGLESSGIKDHLRAELEIKCDKPYVSEQILPSLLDLDRVLKYWRFSEKMFDVIGYDPVDVPRETIKTCTGVQDKYSAIYHMHRNYSLLFQQLCGMFGESAVTAFMCSDKSVIEGKDDVREFFDSCYRKDKRAGE